MIRALLSVLMMSIAFSIAAQEVNWGPELKRKRRYSVDKIIGQNQDGIYVLSMDTRRTSLTPVVEHYDKASKLKYQMPISLGKHFDTYFNESWYYNNELYLFYTSISRKNKMQTVFAQKVEKESGKRAGNPQKLAELPMPKISDYGTLNFSASLDSSHALIMYSPELQIGLLEKRRPKSLVLNVFDKNLKKSWNKQITLRYDEDLLDIVHSDVDNAGNAYVLGKLYNDRKTDKRWGRINYAYKLFSYTNEGKEAVEFDLTLGDKFISDITFKVNASGLITCTGFYSERNTLSIKGAFFFTINPATKEIETKGLKEFSSDFLANLIGKRRAKKGKELYRYYLDEIILRSDGGAVLMAEQFYVVTHTSYSGTGPSRTEQRTYTYYYEDIIVININPDASIAWAVNIPKYQVSSSKDYSSYAWAVSKGKIHLVFNERIAKRSPVILASIDTKGKIDIKNLFTNKDAGIITRPVLCKQTTKNEMVIFGERIRKYKFGNILF